MATATAPTAPVSSALGARPTRVALVGAGAIAASHAEALREIAGVEIAAVCDRDPAKAATFAQRHGVPTACGSLEELLARARPDAAHVLVPPGLHAEVATPLLEAGVHVLLEKPMALSTEEGRRLVETARRSRARLGVNHNFTFLPLFRRLRADVDAGRIGRVQHVVSFQNNPLRQLAAGQLGHWMFREPGNVVLEQAPHPISQLLALLGGLRHAQAAPAGRRDLPGGRVFYETWPVTLECERGTAQLFLAFGREFPESWLHVVGQDGSIRVDLQHGAYAVHEKTRWPDFWESFLTGRRDAGAWRRAARESVSGYVLGLLRLAKRSDPFFLGMKGSLEAFHRALASGAPLPVAGEDGLAVVEACERIARAADLSPRQEGARAVPAAARAEPRAREVAVLGATGFIGRHVVARVLAAGRPVRILARDPSVPSGASRDERVRVVTGDLGSAEAIARTVDGADAVIHLAAGGSSPAEIERTIVEGTRLVAEACLRARARRLLYASTVAVYYLGPGAPRAVTEETPLDAHPRARSHYARAKIESERWLAAMHRERGLPVAILRPAVVVGEGGRPLHSAIGQWPRDTQCVGWGAGDVPLPFVLAEDVAEAFVAALDAPSIEGSSFNLAGDVRLTAREYVAELARATGRPFRFHPQGALAAQAVEIGKWLVKAAIRKPENVFPSWRDLRTRSLEAPLDCSRAKRVLGWAPVAERARFVERGIVAALAPS